MECSFHSLTGQRAADRLCIITSELKPLILGLKNSHNIQGAHIYSDKSVYTDVISVSLKECS